MMIDEAMNRVADRIMRMHNGYVEYLANGGKADKELESDIHALDEVYNALAWYRDQDLIPKKDVLGRIENLKRLERHPDHVITLHHSYLAIMEIPKAEPKGESMITIKRLIDCKGAEQFGSCHSCCKSADQDTEMKRITVSTYLGQGTSICLCDDCFNELVNAANNLERNGDCETCKKFQTEDCELHLSTMHEWCENYEPYIPR